MTRALVALVALALAFPAASLAQAPQTNAPPGNSAIDEYLETVPNSTGSTRPQGTPGAGALNAAERARLETLGADGKTLADAVDATAPTKQTTRDSAELDTSGRSPLGEVFGAFTGSDGGNGMGLALPAILLGALLAALLLVLLRRRAAS